MNILFVCSGNTCRSPLAEALARKAAARRGIRDVTFSSAGTNAWENATASDGALLVGMERDLDLTAHRARRLSPDIVAEADLIFVMSPSHLQEVNSLGGRGKVHLIDEYTTGIKNGRGIADPYGGDLDAYRAAADVIEQEIERVFDRLAI